MRRATINIKATHDMDQIQNKSRTDHLKRAKPILIMEKVKASLDVKKKMKRVQR